MSIKQYFQVFYDDYAAINFALQSQLIYQEKECDKCGDVMKYKSNSGYFYGVCLQCCNKYCNCKQSIFTDSIFSDANIRPNVILNIIYYWAHRIIISTVSEMLQININTISRYYKLMRKACSNYVDSEKTKIGGKGYIVEIDETCFASKKYGRGRDLNQVWIFGGICRETKDIFAIIVDERNKKTLWHQILKHIKAGTIIYSDQWKAYVVIEQDKRKRYLHKTVNHIEGFVNHEENVHTQNIESLWRKLKDCKYMYNGIKENDIKSHIDEYIWRKNNIKNKNADKFQEALKLLSETCFR